MATLTDAAATSAERVAAAKALATSKDPLAIDTLLRGLGSMDQALTTAVIESLEKLGAAKELSKRLQSADTVEQRKVQACVGLRHLKAPESVAALAAALKDPSAQVRKEAALALYVVGPVEAEAALIAALGDADGDVRYGAADALGLVPTVRAKQAIEKQLEKETNPTVRFALDGAARKLEAVR